jgi:uncharacterized protein (TIGR02646 family)
MIRVDRSTVPVPKALLASRVVQERERVASVLSNEKLRDQVRVEFRISWLSSITQDLRALFRGKCAYCESDLSSTQALDIEHFRPKEGASDLEGVHRQHLYYAWLAYEWDNLLVACSNCSIRRTRDERIVGKGDRFPVVGRRAPLLASVAECRKAEHALLLDPSYDEPAEHLHFESTGACTPLTDRGAATATILDLNRESLVEGRRRVAEIVQTLANGWIEQLRNEQMPATSEVEARLREQLSGELPYTAAARDAFARVQQGADLTPGKEISRPDDAAALLDTFAGVVRPAEMARRRSSGATVLSSPPAVHAPQIERAATSRPERYEGLLPLPPLAHTCLTRVSITNFKAIESLELEIPLVATDEPSAAGALMLLGENATGKSSVLEAIALALLGTRQIAKLYLDGAAYIRRGLDWKAPADPATATQVQLWFDGVSQPRSLTIDEKGRFHGDGDPATILLGYGPRRYFRPPGRNFLKAVFNWGESAHDRVQTLFDPIATIGNPTMWFLRLSEPQFDLVIRALRQLLMLDEDAVVGRPTGIEADKEMTFEVDNEPVPLSRLSEGYRTIVATSVDIMRELLRYWPDLESAQGVVLLDEIETHLHPRWKMKIVRLLRSAMPRVQFIFTTHDPLCLRGVNDGEVVVVYRDEDSRVRLVPDLPSVTGLSVQQLLTSEYFGLFTTEDPRFTTQLADYVTLANKADRTEAEEVELREQRAIAMNRLVPGALPEHRIAYQAINEVLRKGAREAQYERTDLNREAMAKAIDLFSSEPSER